MEDPIEEVLDDVSDAELATRVGDGDSLAFEALYRRYAPLVASAARRMLRDASDVDDVVQETFLIAFERLRSLTDPAALRGWIYRIAINRAHRRFRRHRLAQQGDPYAIVPVAELSPDLHAELCLIARALDMPLELRRAWVLRHVMGAALDDVAAACNCSLATVKRRLAEAATLVARFVRADTLPRGKQPSRSARGTNAHGFLIPLPPARSNS
ncbi:MAG TPA: sigma-70 family RNA polymerase sigma factor [Kofleriaceae bacterium]|nr:sigma-70 family RNA polymerase sigma factor [Kofleriaceae bacterium]